MDYRVIQKRLKELGFNPGPIDGIRGRKTIEAVKDFQCSNALAEDGLVGPITLEALFKTAKRKPKAQTFDPYPWLNVAARLLDTKEAPGSANNPLIIGWGKQLKLSYGSDSTPWCGLFVGHCIATALPSEPLPNNPLGARNWERFGKMCSPQPGAVLVFWRGKRTGWQGHVGFYWAEDAKAYHVLGGNQADKVSIARVSKSRLLGARWPSTALAPENKIRNADATGRLSEDEA